MENWILPCNVRFFDVEKHFEEHDTVVWKRGASTKEGDVVYLYLGAPYSQILYRCIVEKEELTKEEVEENKYAVRAGATPKTKYMLLKLEYKYKEGTMTLDKLREHGLGQTQKQARTSRSVQGFINSINKTISNDR